MSINQSTIKTFPLFEEFYSHFEKKVKMEALQLNESDKRLTLVHDTSMKPIMNINNLNT
jgi:hypothetical protein